MRVTRRSVRVVERNRLHPRPEGYVGAFLVLVAFPVHGVLVDRVQVTVHPPGALRVGAYFRFRRFRQVVSDLYLRPGSQRYVTFRGQANVLVVLGRARVVGFSQGFPFLFQVCLRVHLRGTIQGLNVGYMSG